ncbi:hypothetical protein BPAE_0001g00070 [Botrytis paeoniae]|uniref:Uncharacterized protein n=1 Tax=Botrytis paeoniae TaxID=278948 RepID=A0A4Z1GA73_9HELO|nr:hypothetical protein BPAE_0001g00070 [Botrytis paeoniae]
MADLQIHANLAIAAPAVLIPICTATVALRVYARHLKKVGLGADDYLIMGALVGLKQLGYPAPVPSTQIGKPDSNIAFWPGELPLSASSNSPSSSSTAGFSPATPLPASTSSLGL